MNKLIPELTVLNYQVSLNFYTRLAGFQVLYARPAEEFAMLELNGSQLMIEGLNGPTRSWITGPLECPLGRGINLQIEVQNVQTLYDNFQQAHYPIF